MFFKNKKPLDRFFLSSENPFSKKRTLKGKAVIIAFSSALIIFLILGSLIEKKQVLDKEENAFHAQDLKLTKQSVQNSEYDSVELPYDDIEIKPDKKLKKKNISQILHFGDKNSLLGQKILVELIGKVEVSTGNTTPIEVSVLSNITDNQKNDFSENLIEEGSRLFGNGTLEANSERLKITFTRLVDTFGKQKKIKAEAFMPDGSFGIRGKYNSGELKKYGSRMAGNFIGGLSQGLKQIGLTRGGAVLEIGNLKNALLNGVSLSALDYARQKARKNESPKASISLFKETRFFVHFE